MMYGIHLWADLNYDQCVGGCRQACTPIVHSQRGRWRRGVLASVGWWEVWRPSPPKWEPSVSSGTLNSSIPYGWVTARGETARCLRPFVLCLVLSSQDCRRLSSRSTDRTRATDKNRMTQRLSLLTAALTHVRRRREIAERERNAGTSPACYRYTATHRLITDWAGWVRQAWQAGWHTMHCSRRG